MESLRFFRMLRQFCNGDDEFLMDGLKGWKGQILTFGLGRECDFRADNINFYDDHAQFEFYTDTASFPLKTHLTGIHNIYNITAATAVATFLGISKCIITQVTEVFTPVKMRGEIIK